MPNLTYPGVYIEDVDSVVHTIDGVPTPTTQWQAHVFGFRLKWQAATSPASSRSAGSTAPRTWSRSKQNHLLGRGELSRAGRSRAPPYVRSPGKTSRTYQR